MSNTPSSIVCFKNGFSFVCIPVILKDSSDEDKKSNDQVRLSTLGPLPDEVVHGTIGLQPDNPDKLQILSLSKAPMNKKTPTVLDIPEETEFSIQAYLEANIGKHVVLNFSNQDGTHESIGKIKKVLNAATKSFVVIELNDTGADMLIDTSLIISVQAAVDNGNDNSQPRVLVRYHNAGDGEQESKAVLTYLTPGLTWAPSYSLVLDTATKTLKLEGKACLMCDLSFLEGDIIPEVCLVTGQPNMLYQHITDPLVSHLSASDFVNQMEGGRGQSSFGFGGITRQTARKSTGPRAPMASSNMFGAAARSVEEAEGIDSGETVEDFFHYVLKNVPIKSDYPISMDFINKVSSIKYEDVYFVDLNSADMDNKGAVEVKHAISFKNTTGQPLTTAPATVLSKAEPNSKFLVQGLMKYCWPGHDANLEITSTHDVQVNLAVKSDTTEEQEKDSDYTMYSTLHNCEVVLVNYKQESVKCKVEHTLRGALVSSNPAVKNKIDKIVSYHDINPHAKYVWEIIAGPQQNNKIVFSYILKERRLQKVQKGLFN